MDLISIITVNFHQAEATIELLKSIEFYANHAQIEVILVDNGSLQHNEAVYLPYKKDLIYVQSAENLGFAGGNNLGIKHAKGKYLFLVNNDTEFTPGLVDILAQTLDEHPKIGIISPKIMYYDDKSVIQYAGFTPMDYLTCRNKCVGQFETDNGQYDHLVAKTGYIHGAAMMITRAALEKAGGMAENFFLYYEEMDWCDMISRAGFEIWINTNALIYHKESLSVGKNSPLKEFFMNRNRILFIRRNAGKGQQAFFWVYFLLFVCPRNIISYLLKGNFKFISILIRAIGWNLSNSVNSTNLGYKLK